MYDEILYLRKVRVFKSGIWGSFWVFCDMTCIFQKIEMDLLLHSNSTNSNNMAAMTSKTTDYAVAHIKDKTWYEENIKDKGGFRDVSRHIDTRKTKKNLGIKGAGKLKVFVMTADNFDFDVRACVDIVYKYEVCSQYSHPLGKEGEWGFVATCPQGTAYVIFYEKLSKK